MSDPSIVALADPGISDEDKELSLEALKGQAVAVLRDVLSNADSDDVKRKAAVDILNFNRERNVTAPTVSEAQLEFLGRVIVEAEEIRERISKGEVEPRSLESLS